MKILLRCIVFFIVAASICSCSISKVNQAEVVTFRPSDDFVKSAQVMSDQEEDVIGRAVAAKVLANYKAIHNIELNNYIIEVGQTVVAASSRPETFAGYSFLILDTDEVTAMSAPGGYIFLSKGFLRLLPDEDTLAAVLAHELTHVIKRHGLHAIKPEHFANYLKVGEVAASAIDCAGLTQQLLLAFQGAINDVWVALVEAGYSQDQEYEADAGALSILQNAGYKQEALEVALKILEQRKSKGGWFKTHPKPKDRILALNGKISIIKLDSEGLALRKKRFQAALASLLA